MAASYHHAGRNLGSRSMSFDVTLPQAGIEGARLGHLPLKQRSPITTPHYVAISSRGAVPHLAQDMVRDQTGIKALYTAVEDCEYFMAEH